MSREPLTVFPTELAKRRTERRLVLEQGVLDTSGFFTLKKLTGRCEQAARSTGLPAGRIPNALETRLRAEHVAQSIDFAPNQPLGSLSVPACAALLETAISAFSVFAENERAITDWLLAHDQTRPLHGIGQLLSAWRTHCTNMEIADRFTVNAALLRLLTEGPLPAEFTAGLTFRAVRWLNPFEERLIAALKQRLGNEAVHLVSVLPPAHAEAAEERFCAAVRSELMRGTEEEWEPWLEDFADAFETDDSNILSSESNERISFFVSAHPYGEIEDAARRIARDIEGGIAPDEIALIVRDPGPYTDIIPDVFRRFGIPFYFRRGTPAAAHPPVKSLLALLAFPQKLLRDRLCDLLRMPGIVWPGLDEETRNTLIKDLRKKEPPVLRRLPKELQSFFAAPEAACTPKQFVEKITAVIQQHELILPDEVIELIDEIGTTRSRPVPPERMLALFEELLDNTTLNDEACTENGVWVINPLDAAGLRFDSVYLAGMDDRTFPQIPQTDPLLSLSERRALRAFLEERKIHCPRLALSETRAALIQEEILFLTAMSTAREKLTLSYTRMDAAGKEQSPGSFFDRMLGLTGAEDPTHGESFHTIQPPKTCRAEDEVRQTQAWIASTVTSRSRSEIRISKSEIRASNLSDQATQTGCADLIRRWLEKNPEFSATALESLARNRFVFFLEKMLGIKPDRTHEDETDPMDRGTLVHDILEQVYTAVASQSKLYATKHGTGWKLAQSGEIPLAVFDPAKSDEILALTRNIAEDEFTKAERRPSRHLGHPAIWETEKCKLLKVIENFVRTDLETAADENRYPALFEMKFDAAHDLPVSLRNPNCRAGTNEILPTAAGRSSTIPALQSEEIQLKGKIDRIDLMFDKTGNLQRLLVVDYKGKSRSDAPETLSKKIALNLDCQLPLYTFAAQERFFGAHNTPELNARVQAVYHLQDPELKNMMRHFAKKRLTLMPELTKEFLETLFSNINKLREGDLSAEPLIAGYEEYSHICRTRAIDPKEILN
jgi:RecB family exonuclease